MADYYPLLAKAVAGLPDSTAEARHAIYERARGALFGQLRNLDPPVPDEAIEREAQALEVAVARLETEITSRSDSGSGAPVAERDLAGLEPTAGSPAGPSPAHEPSSAPLPEPTPPEPDPLGPAPSASTPPPSRPLKVRREPRPPGTNQGARPYGAPGPGPAFNPMRPASSARDSVPAARTAAQPSAAQDEPPATGANSPGQTASAGRDFDEFALAPSVPEAGALEAPAVEASAPEAPNPSPESYEPAARARLEALHPFAPPFAPGPAQDAGPAKRLVVVAAIVGLVIASVAFAAYKLRDRPEDLVRPQPPPPSTQGEAGAGGKIVDRIGGAGTATQGSAPALTGVPSATADRNDAAKSGSGPANPPIPVAHRAALLVEAPEEKSKVKTFLGTVVWRVDNVSTGPDEPLSLAVRAEIDIPEEKLQVAMTMQKNFDGTLPASHTMKLTFAVPQDSPLGNIKQISVLQMRREDSATGESLKGITVPVMENSFLVGLARGGGEASNLDLLRSREWLDVPMVLANGHIAKLTFEKGPSGQHALDDAMASWQANSLK
jgi:hypothetical protein